MSVVQLRSKAWFGDDALMLDFPPSWKVVEVGPRDSPVLTAAAMRAILSHPIGTPPLFEMATGKNRAAIIVDDLTRPTPAADLLPLLIEELTRAGMPEQAITIVLAGGTHPPASAEEMITAAVAAASVRAAALKAVGATAVIVETVAIVASAVRDADHQQAQVPVQDRTPVSSMHSTWW